MAKNKNSEATPPTLGQKLVEFLPSQHSDPKRAKEQERGLQSLVDLLIPQTKEDIAIDMALSTIPFAKLGKKPVKQFADEAIDKIKEGGEWLGNWMKARKMNPNVTIPSPKFHVNDIFSLPMSKVVTQGKVPVEFDVDLYKKPNVEARSFYDLVNRNFENPRVSYKTDYGNIATTDSPKIGVNPLLMDEDYVTAKSKLYGETNNAYLKRLGIHEHTHALTKNHYEFPPEMEKFIHQMQQNSLGGYNKPTARTYSFSKGSWSNSTEKRANYIKDPTETYARVMEIRHDIKANPLASEVRLNEELLFKKNQPYTELREIYNHESIQKMVNTLPALTGLYVGTKAMQEKSE